MLVRRRIASERKVVFLMTAALLTLGACATLPEPVVKPHSFPKDAYIDEPGRPFDTVGLVRTKVEWVSLNPSRDEDELCVNYYNKAVGDLIKRGRERGADAVIRVRTVTFLIDGRHETHRTPQCSDDGGEGQVLAEGIAIRWKPMEVDLPSSQGRVGPAVPTKAREKEWLQETGDFPPPKPRQSARPVPLRRTSPAPAKRAAPARRQDTRTVRETPEGVNPGSPLFNDFSSGAQD